MRGPEADLTLLSDTLREAGKLALRYWRHKPKFYDKPGDAGPVSEADLAVNDLLLAKLRAARPEYGWLSEETADTPERLARDDCFIIDPIDGTRSFIQGEDTFAIAAGICHRGRMTAGAVYLPALERLYTAHAEGPARMNGQTITASERSAPDGATMLTATPNLAASHWPGGLPDVRRAFRPSLAYRLCLVAEGRHDSMVSFRPTWEWDIAAASLIVERAGGRATAGNGAALIFNTPGARIPSGVLAAGAALHPRLLALHLPS